MAPVEAAIQGSPQAEEDLVRFNKEDGETIDLVLRQFRCLIADLCQQFNGGHPGSAMGMAAIGVALWKYAMRYSPSNPSFFNRDRFVLSNGHACLFQYVFLHLTGYRSMTMDQLKSYHSARRDSLCPGHPEIEHEGIEVTTGPLGQGLANAVGLAMASRHLAATYNRAGPEGAVVVDNTTWCVVGDACLQEGVGMEAIQLAGHWRLGNLIVVYDNNQITCDGSVDVSNSAEDVDAKMRASGWHVIDVADGCHDVEALVAALLAGKAEAERPTFVNVRTVIGVGSGVAGDARAHGAAYGADDVRAIKTRFGLDPDEHFVLADEVYGFFREMAPRGERLEEAWEARVHGAYARAHPELHAELSRRMRGELSAPEEEWKAAIPPKSAFPTTPTPSRKSAGIVCNPLAEKLASLVVGTADLTPSVNMAWPSGVAFQHPGLRTACGSGGGDYGGRYVHWGVREFAMAAVSNGLAAFHKGAILPVTSTFFMFYLYAAPGIRMGALQSLQQIHMATHDSIGTGEDGPTHQPVELAALYRAMPNLLYFRPCDTEETAGALLAALRARDKPSMLSLSRHPLEQYPLHSSREGVARGAYVFCNASSSSPSSSDGNSDADEDKDEKHPADVTLIGVGSEMALAMQTRRLLSDAHGLRARVVSFPCQRLFDAQPLDYKRRVLGHHRRSPHRQAPRVVVEAYAANGWERYADAGYTMSGFGKSLPGDEAYRFFGFEAALIAEKVKELVDEVRREGGCDFLRGEFRDLNVAGKHHH